MYEKTNNDKDATHVVVPVHLWVTLRQTLGKLPHDTVAALLNGLTSTVGIVREIPEPTPPADLPQIRALDSTE